MTDKMIDTMNEQALKLMAPMKEFNQLAVAKAEKLAHLQLASLQDYSDMSIAQLRAALEVSDTESLQAYVAKQSEFIKHLGEKLAADARAVAELSKEFGEEAQQLGKKSVSNAQESVSSVTAEAA